jgi:hypothetical protein
MNHHHVVTVILVFISTIVGVIAGFTLPFLLVITGMGGVGMGAFAVGTLIGAIGGGGGLPLYVFWQRQRHYRYRAIATERLALFMGVGLLLLAGLAVGMLTVLYAQPDEIRQNFEGVLQMVAYLPFLLPTLGATFILSRSRFSIRYN